MAYQNIILEKELPLAFITVNRPTKLNALNLKTFEELDHALDDIRQDEQIGGLLVMGSGEKAFVAGADISEIQHLDLESGKRFSQIGQQVFMKIETLGKPSIALINGYALGGGCEFALSCHLRLATPNAQFGQPEVNLGLIPGYGGTQRLPRLIGRARALEYLLTADMISADQALTVGLINRIVAPEELVETGKKLLLRILTKGPVAVKYILETVHRGLNTTLEEGQAIEAAHFGMACSTDDMKEGTTAFLEKRKPQFKGR